MEEKTAPPPSYEASNSGSGGIANPNYDAVYSPPLTVSTAPVQPYYGIPMGNQSVYGNTVITQPAMVYNQVQAVPDHTTLAVMSAICCCPLIGLFAVMKALDSRTALANNDIPLAMTRAQEAKRLSIITIICGAVVCIVAVVVVVVVLQSSLYYY
ncbi:uncharacterized protein LOC131945031 [Physella acuta]|uniref:uncharacterized protein LOC131945031 n=1 Tax=Physella acuta TaxID=109671 RepID=UPI0027DE5E6F|nr:uncharacterized protein LOC131945031 [Physella acuta]